MKTKFLIIGLVIAFMAGCATKGGWPCWSWQKNTDQKNDRAGAEYLRTNGLPELAIMAQKRDGTNYIGIYMGMIAEHAGNGSVMMFSATSGECLKWIPYQSFMDIFVNKTKPEYEK